MRRFINVLSFIVVLCFAISYNVAAAEQTEFTVKAELDGNNTINAEYYISKNSDIAALGFEVLYDSDALEVENIQNGALAESGLIQWNDKEAGKIIVSYINTEPLKNSGSILSVKYSLLDDYDKEDIELSINITEAVDGGYEAVPFVVNSCIVKNPLYKPTEKATESVQKPTTSEKETTPIATENSEKESNKEEFADKEIISEINKLLGNENHLIYSVDVTGNELYDENKSFEAVFGKNENGEIEKLTPLESDDKKGAYYKDVEKYEEVYVVEKGEGQATQDSVITIGETKQPDNKVLIIVLSVLVILGVVCTLLIIKIKKKEGRKNEKKV